MIKLTNSILNFTANSTERREGYKSFVEYYELYKSGKRANEKGVTLEEMNDKMLKLFTDEIERMSGKKMSTYSDIATYTSFSDVQQAAFAVIGMITDLIIPDALIKDLGYIAEIKNGGWGESLKVELQPRDLFVVSKGGRNRRRYDITRFYKGESTIIPEPHGITVGISLYDILTKKISLAELVSRAAQSMEVNVKRDIYYVFAQAMDNLPSSGTNSLLVNGWSTDAAVKLIQKVEAWNGGAKAIMLGTKLALSKVIPESTNVRFLLGDDYFKLGHLREYFGTSVIEMEQIADYNTEFGVLLPDDKIYVICPGVDKAVKVFFEGSTQSKIDTDYENANLVVTGTIYKSYGVGAISSALAGVIKLS